jgi:hypothetical protein
LDICILFIIIKKKKSENEYWWNVQGAYSHPFKWIPEIQQLIRDATDKFEERLNGKKTFQAIFNDKVQLSKEPVSQVSGGGQYFVKANCYCLTLEGAVWRVVENLIKVQIQTTINVEEYLGLIKEAFKLFDSAEISPTIKKVVKETVESADNIE